MHIRLKILHLEESLIEAERVSEALNKNKFSVEIRVARTREEYVKALQDFSPEMILSEYLLPDFSYTEALAILRESNINVPFIIVSGSVSDDMAETLRLNGVDDYILKYQFGRLPSAIMQSLEKYRMQAEQQRLLEALKQSDNRQREEKIIHLNRLYAFLSQINKTLVHARDAQTVFREVCRIACQTGKFRTAWIGMNNASNKEILLVEGCNAPPHDFSELAGSVYKEYDMLGQILDKNPYYVCNNIQTDFVSENWKSLAANAGYGACMILPIQKGGQIIGCYNLYATETDFFTEDEIALLQEAAGDISFALDIFETERLKRIADKQLQHKQLRLNQAQAIAHLGSWELDVAAGVSEWSAEACRIYGLDENDPVQTVESWISFVHPDDLDYVLKINQDAIDSLQDTAYYHRIIRKDGKIRYLHVQTQLEMNAEGIPLILHGVMHDVTEMEQSQQALRNSESNLQAIFANTSEGFILTDKRGTIKYFNHRSWDFVRLNTGKQLVVGDSLFEMINESRRDGYKESITKVLAGETWKYEHAYENTQGEQQWFYVTVIPVHAGGQITGLCLTITETTERKTALDLLQRSESNLNAIMNNTDAFIYSVDTDFKYITFNNALKSMMKEKYDIDVAPGYDTYDFIRKFDPESVEQWAEINQLAFSGEIVKFEKEITINGAHHYFNFSIHPIWENNKITGLSCFVNDLTKEKYADERRRFKANLLNTIGQAVIFTDLNGIINYWNKAAEQIYGWTEQEAMGKYIVDLTPSQTSKDQAIEIMDTLKTGKSWSGEFLTRRKNGTYFPAFVTNTPVYDPNQKLTGIIGVSSDITELKSLQSLLEEATSMARVGGYEANLQTGKLFWSPMTRQIHEVPFDYTPDIENALAFYKKGPSLDKIYAAFYEAGKSGTAFDLELEIVTAKGNLRWVRAIGEAEFVNGKCMRVYGSFQDIDLMKKAEQNVLKAYEEKNIILESIGDAFFALDSNWIVTYWNKEAEIILNCPKSSILGKNLWDVFPEAVDTLFYHSYHKAVEQNTIQHFESFYEKGGKWFDVNAYPSANGLSVYFRDITERKQSETQLKELHNSLQNYTKELIASNKGLEQFSYIVSHNLRAPVANIIGLAALVGKDYPAEIKEQFLSGILENVKRLDEVITDLNTILHVKREVSEKKEIVDLQQLVENIQTSIQGTMVKEKVRILTDFKAVGQMITTKSYLHSIFHNLIMNSIKYRQQELFPEIRIKSSLNRNTVTISFQDNGLGIDLSKKDLQVFGLYKRFHQHVDGKGLGLFMVKTQVEMMGGKIAIISEINKGTEFIIDFPLDKYKNPEL